MSTTLNICSCFLLIIISFQAAVSEAASATAKRYFDMPVREWLTLSGSDKMAGTIELLSLNNREVSPDDAESVEACMNVIGKSPVWVTSTVGALLTKCSFDMGVTKSPSGAQWDELVACVQEKVPDFSKDEFLSLGLSATGDSLAKDSESDPIMTPRTKRILERLGGCGM